MYTSQVILTAPELLSHGEHNVDVFHKFVMSLFPHEAGATPREKWDILWSVNAIADPSRLSLTVQSAIKPSLEYVTSELVDSLTVESQVLPELVPRGVFKVTLNAHAGVLKHGIMEWLEYYGLQHGVMFSVRSMTKPRQIYCQQGAQVVPYTAVTVIGDYDVLEPAMAQRMRNKGIGKAKSYGMGLIVFMG